MAVHLVSRLSLLLFTLIWTSTVRQALAIQKEFSLSPHVTAEAARDSVRGQLDAVNTSNARLRRFEDELQWMYASLPKNAAGKLDHPATRYALHRFFLYRNGWHVRGLENKAHAHPDEWIPDMLQKAVEERAGSGGVGLSELAAFAATIEDLAQHEAAGRLAAIWALHNVQLSERIDKATALDVVGTFYANFLKEGRLQATSAENAKEKLQNMSHHYPGWAESQVWLNSLIDSELDYDADRKVTFDAVVHLAGKIGEEYFRFNDHECTDLTHAMREDASQRPGRVRLSVFYWRARYSHWRFNEKIDYLRDLGALDDSDPKQPYVIIPNYVMSLNNCLDSSTLYSVCCRNPCEDLMREVERGIGAEAAPPQQIAQLVAQLPSESVGAPRALSSRLLGRLNEVAVLHGGLVPIHGRLFAQWMHHAYPMECPYPHEAGSTKPMNAAEWASSTGQSVKATLQEVQEQLDTCLIDERGKPLCDDSAEDDLMWTGVEELFARVVHRSGWVQLLGLRSPLHLPTDEEASTTMSLLVLTILAVCLLWRTCQRNFPSTADSEKLAQARARSGVAVLAIGGTAITSLAGLLDQRIVGLAVVCSALHLIIQQRAGSRIPATKLSITAPDVFSRFV